MGEPSSGECSPLCRSFNCLTVLPGSASILIRTEIGNGVLAGWGGVLWVVHFWTSALCGLPSFTLSLALTRVRSPHPFRFLPPGWRSKKGQEVQRKEAERGREREKKKRKRKISKQSRNSACRKYRNHSTGLIKNAVDVQPVWVTAWDCRICTILRICTVISPGSWGWQHSAPGASFVFIWSKPSFGIWHSGWSGTCLGSPWQGGGRVGTTAHNFHFLFQCKWLHSTCTLPVYSPPLSPQYPGTWYFSVLLIFASVLGPSTCLGQTDAS